MPSDVYLREYVRHVESLQALAGCITPARFLTSADASREPRRTYQVGLGRDGGVPLRGIGGVVRLTAGQRFHIVEYSGTDQITAKVQTYWYTLTTATGAEIIAWHWTPDVIDPGQRRWPHLHVGHAVLAGGGSYLPGSFGRLHVPTAVVPFAAVIRFAIEELGVAPLRADWQAVLSDLLGTDA